MPTNYGPFGGDGRGSCHPNLRKHGAEAIRVKRGTARLLVDHFLETGSSYHSARGQTLWVIKDWAESQGIPLVITEHKPEGWIMGYTIKPVWPFLKEGPTLKGPTT